MYVRVLVCVCVTSSTGFSRRLNVINIKLYTTLVLLEHYRFMPISMTYIMFQVTAGVTDQLKVVLFG